MPQDDGDDAGSRSDSKAEQALSGGEAQRVGRFRFFIDDQRWEWSSEVQQIHGYAAGELPNPSTAQVLAHKHPDDYEHVLGLLDDTCRTRVPFSTRHRMIDRAGRMHSVNLVGDLLRDDDGAVVGTQGFYIDVTPAEDDFQRQVTERVGEVVDRRAVIEQAKGMLALIYDIEDDAAFELLRWISQRSNQKLRDVAIRMVAQFRMLSGPQLPERTVFERALRSLMLNRIVRRRLDAHD